MHKFLGGDAEKAVIYRSENLFSKEKRYIHFFADVPHLIKTVLLFAKFWFWSLYPLYVEPWFLCFMVTYIHPLFPRFRMWT